MGMGGSTGKEMRVIENKKVKKKKMSAGGVCTCSLCLKPWESNQMLLSNQTAVNGLRLD